ncbi:MAG: hypothetical protein RJB66_2710 [Pseudomonadota bacterium]|jgi:ATP-dependent Clp protease ATP-binding subunit ClpA
MGNLARVSKTLFGAMALVSSITWAQSRPGTDPDLNTLKESGFIMGPGNTTYQISEVWKKPTTFMKEVSLFDDLAQRIEEVVCGSQQNKSVLVVGEPSQAYLYLFARLASGRVGSQCPSNMWHAEINVSKIESGHRYVGDVDQYWQQKILAPSDSKNVIMYLNSVSALIGIGSHSNDETGIEREYVANISAGRMRSIAFIDKFEYNEIIRSRNSYVLEAFGDRLILPPLNQEQTLQLSEAYLRLLYPNLKLNNKDLQYIVKNIAYYQPNRQEPDRTISVLNALVRGTGASEEPKPEELKISFESEHPYPPDSRREYFIEAPGYNAIQLEFSSFDIENNFDHLDIYDANNPQNPLTRLTGRLTAGARTAFFYTNKLKIVLNSDSTGSNQGFVVSRAYGKVIKQHTFTREEARRAVLTIAQVPAWFIDRDFSVIKNLEANLNSDVVGVVEGKKDLVRLAKNGFVAGRTDDKPVATALLAGPTGTGKSYVAKKMADFMQMKLITMDMTTYKEKSSFKNFQEVMSRHLTNTPFAVYLFEEIDKASIEVLDQLYFMMDEGVFYDPYQRPLFARGAFIIMTTNAASDVVLKNPTHPDLRALVMADLKQHFRMSFLNRFDAISIFKPFSDTEFRQLANILVDKKLAKIKENFEWNMVVDAPTRLFISVYGRSPEFGARPMERMVENTLGVGVAEYQLNFGAITEGSIVEVTKLPDPFKLRLSVNKDGVSQSIDYRVDSDINSLLIRNSPIEKVLHSIRMYQN